MTTVAVIAAHADDEALGCGGTMAKHAAAGDDVHVIFLADGVTSRQTHSANDFDQRQDAASTALKILGAASMTNLGFPDNKMDSVPLLDIVQKLEAELDRIQPEVIYTHHAGDLNVDHRLCCQAVMTACRPMPGASVKQIYSFEVLSSTEWAPPGRDVFTPNHFVDITQYLEDKINALQAYEREMRAAPHSRSIEHARALTVHRGHSVGVARAEAFVTLRSIT